MSYRDNYGRTNGGQNGGSGVLIGVACVSLVVCCILVVIVYYYNNSDDIPSWANMLGVTTTQAPTTTTPTTTSTPAKSKSKSTTSEQKSSKQQSSSKTLPINKKVIIYSNTCKSGKSILSTDDTASSTRNNSVALWCQVNGMDGGGIWKIEKVSGSSNKGFHYIRHSKTRQLLSTFGTSGIYLRTKIPNKAQLKAQHWSIKPFSGGSGFIIENRLLKEKGQYAVLDANGRGCMDGQKTWMTDAITYWNKKTSEQVWNIIAAKPSTNVSQFTNLSVCASGEYRPDKLIGPDRGW